MNGNRAIYAFNECIMKGRSLQSVGDEFGISRTTVKNDMRRLVSAAGYKKFGKPVVGMGVSWNIFTGPTYLRSNKEVYNQVIQEAFGDERQESQGTTQTG